MHTRPPDPTHLLLLAALAAAGCVTEDDTSLDSLDPDITDSDPAATDDEPDDSEPDDSEPDDSEPDDSEPDDSEPDDSEPDDSEPDDSEPDDSEPDSTGSDGSSEDIDAGLERLEALEVMVLGEVFEARTEWTESADGEWTASEVSMTDTEIAGRVDTLAALSEAAVDSADTEIPTDWTDPDSGASNLCVYHGSNGWCLTISEHEADLEALNALEIVEVDGILRDQPSTSGFCYTSWEQVTQSDCERAQALRAIVEATAHLPTSSSPVD